MLICSFSQINDFIQYNICIRTIYLFTIFSYGYTKEKLHLHTLALAVFAHRSLSLSLSTQIDWTSFISFNIYSKYIFILWSEWRLPFLLTSNLYSKWSVVFLLVQCNHETDAVSNAIESNSTLFIVFSIDFRIRWISLKNNLNHSPTYLKSAAENDIKMSSDWGKTGFACHKRIFTNAHQPSNMNGTWLLNEWNNLQRQSKYFYGVTYLLTVQ